MQRRRRRWRLRRINTRLYIPSEEVRRLRSERMREFGVRRVRYLVAIPMLILAILLVAWLKMPDLEDVQYQPIEDPFGNPLIGWATPATDLREAPCGTLVYAEATWRELEPEMDQFDLDGFERKNHFEHWLGKGYGIILRIVADRPGEPGHMDIPDWLYEMIDGEGVFYEGAEGGGFSPNYANMAVRNRHNALIWAIAERYNDNPGLAFVEIGSLGHDGLWRVTGEEEMLPLPPPNIARSYTWHYTDALGDVLKLMCRPYREVRTLSLGIYNPSLGDAEITWDLLDTIAHGGYDEQIAADLYPIGDFWTCSPSAAHIDPALELEALFTDEPGALERQMRESHLSYAVVRQPLDGLSERAHDEMTRATFLMGYRFWVRSAAWNSSVRRGYRSTVRMEIRNDGVAPLYGQWQVALALQQGGEIALLEPVALNAIDIQPGKHSVYIWIDIPLGFKTGVYELTLGILDPQTEAPAIRFAMEECGDDLWVRLGELAVVN